MEELTEMISGATAARSVLKICSLEHVAVSFVPQIENSSLFFKSVSLIIKHTFTIQ